MAKPKAVDAIRNTSIGTLSSLSTTTKTDVVSAINELFQSASNGKSAIATALTGKGTTASSSETFTSLANKITGLSTISQGGSIISSSTSSNISQANLWFSSTPNYLGSGPSQSLLDPTSGRFLAYTMPVGNTKYELTFGNALSTQTNITWNYSSTAGIVFGVDTWSASSPSITTSSKVYVFSTVSGGNYTTLKIYSGAGTLLSSPTISPVPQYGGFLGASTDGTKLYFFDVSFSQIHVFNTSTNTSSQLITGSGFNFVKYDDAYFYISNQYTYNSGTGKYDFVFSKYNRSTGTLVGSNTISSANYNTVPYLVRAQNKMYILFSGSGTATYYAWDLSANTISSITNSQMVVVSDEIGSGTVQINSNLYCVVSMASQTNYNGSQSFSFTFFDGTFTQIGSHSPTIAASSIYSLSSGEYMSISPTGIYAKWDSSAKKVIVQYLTGLTIVASGSGNYGGSAYFNVQYDPKTTIVSAI